MDHRTIDAAHVEELRQELDRLTKLSGLELDQDLTPGLHQMFKHLVKPIAVLNDPDKRELDEERERVVEHIAEITPNNVRQALNASLLATEEGLREYVLEAVMDIRERSRLELDEVRNHDKIFKKQPLSNKKCFKKNKILIVLDRSTLTHFILTRIFNFFA